MAIAPDEAFRTRSRRALGRNELSGARHFSGEPAIRRIGDILSAVLRSRRSWQ